jgi:hypothetical protein
MNFMNAVFGTLVLLNSMYLKVLYQLLMYLIVIHG